MNLKRVGKNGGLVIVSIVAMLVVLEFGIRLKYGAPPISKHPQMSQTPTEYGYILTPNQSGGFSLDQPVGANSHGFRDREWDAPKPAGGFRAMCVGDSMTFGHGVSVESAYPRVLDAMIKRAGGNAEVISAGVPGWNTVHELSFLKNKGVQLEPDLVILGFYPNDFSRKSEILQPVLTRDGALEARPPWVRWLPYPVIYFLKRSALFVFLKDRVDNLLDGSDTFEARMMRGEVDFSKNGRIRDGLERLLEIKRVCADHRIEFMVAFIPSIHYFRGPGDVIRLNEHLKEFCHSHDIRFVDLSEGFWAAGVTDKNKFYLHPWDFHLSPLGHKRIAEQLYPSIRSVLERHDAEN